METSRDWAQVGRSADGQTGHWAGPRTACVDFSGASSRYGAGDQGGRCSSLGSTRLGWVTTMDRRGRSCTGNTLWSHSAGGCSTYIRWARRGLRGDEAPRPRGPRPLSEHRRPRAGPPSVDCVGETGGAVLSVLPVSPLGSHPQSRQVAAPNDGSHSDRSPTMAVLGGGLGCAAQVRAGESPGRAGAASPVPRAHASLNHTHRK